MKFDTRHIKPKLYNTLILSVLTLCLMIALLYQEDPLRILWANMILIVFILLTIISLISAFFKQLQYNPYSYNTVIYSGFALFLLFLLSTHVHAAAEGWFSQQPFLKKDMLELLADSAKSYMYLTAPFLAVFSGSLLISNLALIRHEGKSFVNLLGILLAVCLVGGEIIIALLDRWISADPHSHTALRVLVNAGSAIYLYFECMMIGTIIADAIAALHVPERDKDFLIVLGCGLRKDGTPTPLLQGRLDQALAFDRRQKEETGKEAYFIVSGGQGPDEVQSEAASMKAYLMSRGVEERRIIAEDQSTDTAENMKYSKEKIMAVNPEGKIAFFTTNYHVFRSGIHARRAKMRAQGMGARTKWYYWPNAAVREFIGVLTGHTGKQALIFCGILAGYIWLTMKI